jgi:type II secretory pathway pseudopilin PulG
MKNSLMIRVRSCFKGFTRNTAAFSIIELTIVLMVIGVIISMTLKGSNLLERARVQAVKQDIRFYQASVASFRERYQALPGDMRNAADHLSARQNVPLLSGNSNGLLDTPQEQLQFWQHLVLADMLKGLSVSANTEAVYGATLPEARIGGGYNVVFKKVGNIRKNWIRLAKLPQDDDSDIAAALTPAQAFEIDRELDDGSPTSGNVIAAGDNCRTGDQYSKDSKQTACVLYFSME